MDRFLSQSQVSEVIGLQKGEIYRRIRKGEFPVPVRLGHRTVRWRESEVKHWMDCRERTTIKALEVTA